MLGSKKIWWLVPAIFGGVVLLAAGILAETSPLTGALALKEGLSIALSLLFTFLPAMLLVNAYPTKVGILGYATVTGLFFGIIAAILHGIARNVLMSDAEMLHIATWLDQSQPLIWVLYPAFLLLFCVTEAQQRRIVEIRERFALQKDAAALLKEAELFKLRQQLQPHFLYNSLNAVAALAVTAPDKATEMISRLADFLRTAVRQGKSELVPLDEELDYLRQYLWIEAVRFGDRLHIEWSVEEGQEPARIPPFLLQPVMENAIRFAVYGRTGVVTIGVRIERSPDLLRIHIENPFDPSLKPSGGTGFGLEGIRRRLWLVYARKDLLDARPANDSFITTLLIPQ